MWYALKMVESIILGLEQGFMLLLVPVLFVVLVVVPAIVSGNDLQKLISRHASIPRICKTAFSFTLFSLLSLTGGYAIILWFFESLLPKGLIL